MQKLASKRSLIQGKMHKPTSGRATPGTDGRGDYTAAAHGSFAAAKVG